MSEDARAALTALILESKPSKIVSRGNELVRRCPYCGDSKNPNHHHFYIGMDAPFPFMCQICKTSGFLNREVLRDLSADTDLSVVSFVEIGLKKFFRDNKIANTRSISQNLFRRAYTAPLFTENFEEELSESELRKLNYFLRRMKIQPDIEYLNSLNLVVSLKKFLNLHDIRYLTEKDDDFVRLLARNYLGYLSRSGTALFMRDVRPKTNQRHWQYNVSYGHKNVDTFYVVSKELDLTAPKITLNMAEGFFSLIGVYEMLGRPSDPTQVFASPHGKGFNRVNSYLNSLGFLDMDINYFADSDQSVEFFERLVLSNKILRENRGEINIFYNTIEDDFGHPLDKLNPKRIRL